MELALRQVGPTLVISFVQRTDLEGKASTVFKERLKSLIADGTRSVVMDLGNVGFIDSEGLGALISCLKVLRQVEGDLVLSNVSEPVDAVLRITRLSRVFHREDDVESALRALAPAARVAETVGD